MSEPTKQAPEPPAYGRPIQQIIADLKKDIPSEMLAQKTLKGSSITYLPWYRAARMLDWYAPGWLYEIKSIQTVPTTQKRKDGGKEVQEAIIQIVVTVRLGVVAAEGTIWREATGVEDEDATGYGDPVSNACSMALRRAAALFGLGRSLYEK